MDLIVLSKNYPTNYSSHKGIFVEEQIRATKDKIDGSLTVISPIPWSPRILWFAKKWMEYGKTEKYKVKDGNKVYYPRYLVIPGKLFFPLQGFFMYLSVKALLKKVIKANKNGTILHTHTILPDGLAGTLLKRKFKIPHICTVHGSDINLYPFRNKLSYLLTKYVLKQSDYIVTVSNKLKKKTLLIINAANNTSVIYNGADIEKFKPIPKEVARHKLGMKETNNIILFIGNLKAVKGVNYLLEAFAKLQEDKGKEIRLFLIGDGEEKDKLILLTKSLKIENKVFFFGRRPHSEIPLWLNIADIFVLPSISEGFPTIIPEAMMCGIPVLASNVGGIPEIMTDSKTGYLVEPGNINQIKDRVKLLLDNKSVRQTISKTAIDESRKYTWENNALKHIKIYENILKQYYEN